jgi:hypothetical protein
LSDDTIRLKEKECKLTVTRKIIKSFVVSDFLSSKIFLNNLVLIKHAVVRDMISDLMRSYSV